MKKMKDLKRGDKVWLSNYGGCKAYYVRKIRVCEPCVVISLEWEDGYCAYNRIVGHASGMAAVDITGDVYYSDEDAAKSKGEDMKTVYQMSKLRDVIKYLLEE